MVDVKIKLLKDGIMPTKAHDDDAAWDCYAREEAIVGGANPTLIGLGFCLELPKGYHAEIVPRSSIGLKTRLRMPNSVGIIDAGYRNEVKAMYESKIIVGVKEHSNREIGVFTGVERIRIHKGDRICQMLIVKDPEVQLVQVNELGDSERGEGGFGSTGV